MNNTSEKSFEDIITYEELVDYVNDNLPSIDGDFINCEGFKMDEVNAWTYWQGRGNRHPKILLLGQDWGTYNEQNKKMISHIREMMDHPANESDKVTYFLEPNDSSIFATDRHLCELFKELGYPNILETRYDDLFFTNLIPGFRSGPESSGNYKATWVNDTVRDELKKLVEILQPEVIICLGHIVYHQVLRTFENNVGDWSAFLDMFYMDRTDGIPHPVIINNRTAVFPVAHPGVFGTRSRSIEEQKHDWKRIKAWIDDKARLKTLLDEVDFYCSKLGIAYPGGYPYDVPEEELQDFVSSWSEFDPLPDLK